MSNRNRKSAGNERIVLPPTTRPREGRTHKRVEVFAPKYRKGIWIRYGLCSYENMRYLLLNNKADKDA